MTAAAAVVVCGVWCVGVCRASNADVVVVAVVLSTKVNSRQDVLSSLRFMTTCRNFDQRQI